MGRIEPVWYGSIAPWQMVSSTALLSFRSRSSGEWTSLFNIFLFSSASGSTVPKSQARGVEGATGDEPSGTFARRQVGADGRDGARPVGIEHQDLQRVAHVVVVVLIRAYAVHDYLGVGGDQKVEGRSVRTVSAVVVGLG